MFKITRTLAMASITLCMAAAPAAAQTRAEASVILVHGAFGDGSAWNKVIPLIERPGVEVIAVQLPLTSLTDDAAATRRAIDRASGPVILVGHSWGGTVITQAGTSDKTRALVYVAAFANLEGKSAGDMSAGFTHAPGLDELQIDGKGFARLSANGIARFFAPQASIREQRTMFATQGPIRVANFGEAVDAAAWQGKPSWAVVAGADQMIVPALQEAMATQIGATITRIDSDHAAMVSHPGEIAQVILQAVAAVRRR
jgi:pimeloyl-ACP methyl ester carboxylesterase